VTAGVLTLGLSIVAPGAVLADADPAPGRAASSLGRNANATETGAVLGHCHLTANGDGPAIWIPSNPTGIDAGHGEHQGGEEHLVGDDGCVAANGGAPVEQGKGNGSGQGQGNGDGQGNDNGNGQGNGDGQGNGNGNGQGNGNGNGEGNGDGQGGGGGDGTGGTGTGTPVVPAGPSAPTAPVVESDSDTPRRPQPVIISSDRVDAPPAAAPAPAEDEPEVLGVTTTRTPTQEVAGAMVTTLPRTGTDHTGLLVVAGGGLVLAGWALQLASRYRSTAAGGRLPAA
jgi:hypothetical protein